MEPNSMTPATFKLGRHEAGTGMTEHRHPHTFEFTTRRGRETALLAPQSGHIEILLDLAEAAIVRGLVNPPAFRLAYVLLVPLDQPPLPEGKYEMEAPLGLAELRTLLGRYREFFEADARHHLRLVGEGNQITLEYNQHNYLLVHGSGPVRDVVEQVAESNGLKPGTLELPIPHTHHHHPVYNETTRAFVAEIGGVYAPLDDED